MGCGPGPIDARHAIAMRAAAGALFALTLAGCGHANVQVSSSGAPPAGVTSGGSISIRSGSTAATALAVGVLIGATYGGGDADMGSPQRVPELAPDRRVVEQDCAKPIVDWSANLKCR